MLINKLGKMGENLYSEKKGTLATWITIGAFFYFRIY